MHRIFATTLSALSVAGFATTACAQAGNMVHIDPNFKVDPAMLQKLAPVLSKMGSGYNSLTDEVLGEGGCVTGTIIPPDAEGSSVNYQLELVTSLDQFVRDTSVEASVSGAFGSFSASVKSKLQESQKSNSASTHLLIREYVQTAEINLNNPRLKLGKALALLAAAKDPTKYDFFMRACGDSYVSTIYTGGEYIALLSSENSDEDIKKSVSVTASASYGSTFNSSAEFNESISSFKSRSNLSVLMTRIGGTGDLPQMSAAQGDASINAILEYAAKLPSNVIKFPVIYNIKSSSYVQAGADLPEPNAAKAAYNQLKANANKIGEAIVDLKRALKSYDLFDIPIRPGPNDIKHVAQSNLVAAEADLATLNRILNVCGQSFWVAHSCDAPPQFLSDSYSPPPTPVFIVRQLDTKYAGTVSVSLPGRMKTGIRGRYCWDAGDFSHCAANGASYDKLAYVQLQGARYDGGEHVGGPGDVAVTVKDWEDGYGDNWGDLYFVAYQ